MTTTRDKQIDEALERVENAAANLRASVHRLRALATLTLVALVLAISAGVGAAYGIIHAANANAHDECVATISNAVALRDGFDRGISVWAESVISMSGLDEQRAEAARAAAQRAANDAKAELDAKVMQTEC